MKILGDDWLRGFAQENKNRQPPEAPLRFQILLCLAFLLVGCSGSNVPASANKQAPTPKVTVNKTGYFPGETIVVTFVAGADFDESAWIGIFPTESEFGPKSFAKEPELPAQRLQKRSQGVLKFEAPAKPGGYNARMYDNGSNGKEVNLSSFNVDEGEYPAVGLSEEEYAPGGQIEVRYWVPEAYRDSALVAIVPTETGELQLKDALSHKETAGKALGKLVFVAPENPGNYDARLKWSGKANGGEMSGVSTVSFIVK